MRLRVLLALGALSCLAATPCPAQEGAQLTVRVTVEGRPLEGALVRAGRTGAQTDASGAAHLSLPAGEVTVVASRIGFAPDSLRLPLREGADTLVTIALSERATEIAPVVVTATRGERRIEDEPVRVEVLAGEDVGEKSEMRPSDATMLLSEMSGVRVQRTGPATGAATLRLQGLRGRYTLTLADGLPIYGAAGGLGVLQLPPLDLRQVEVIKGPASALYGSGALAGAVNLVSRRPERADEAVLNGSSLGGGDALLYRSRPWGQGRGYSLLAGAHHQEERDVGGDGWADVPGFTRGELRPRLFWSDSSGGSLFATAGLTAEDRRGGTVAGAVAPDGAPFVQEVDTRRGDMGLVARRPVRNGLGATVRASASEQWQRRRFGGDRERDRRGTAFAEATLGGTRGEHDVVGGAAVQRDDADVPGATPPGYAFTTTSLFAQDSYGAGRRLSLAASGRLDHNSRYGTILSPRLGALVKLPAGWALRASAGGGWFGPTPFVEEAEVVGVSRLRGFERLAAERVRHGSVDVSGVVRHVQLNGTLFASVIANAVQVAPSPTAGPGPAPTLDLFNARGPTRTSGAELYAVYGVEPVLLSVIYTYVRATEPDPDGAGRRDVPLTPRHTAGVDLLLDFDETGTSIALEGFYSGRQSLDEDPYRTTSVPYTEYGVMITQRVGRVRLFVNGENLANVRQTRHDPLLLRSRGAAGRWVTDQWGPLEGRSVNAGVKVSM